MQTIHEPMVKTLKAVPYIDRKVYISGKISGLRMEAVVEKFKKAEDELYLMGYRNIVNPLELDHGMGNIAKDDLSWGDYMRVDIKALCDCEAMYVLKDWKDSKGASLEVHIARELDMELIFELEGIS